MRTGWVTSKSAYMETTLNCESAVYHGPADRVFDELGRLASLVGIEVTRTSGAVGVLNFTCEGARDGHVLAYFHEMFAPYFAQGRVDLDLRTDTADILELMVSVGSTLRGQVIGVCASAGGVGTTSCAAMIARECGEGTGLIDANPASAGIDLVLSIHEQSGTRWADVARSGGLLAGRLVESLPVWNGVRVLSSDERGSFPTDDVGVRAISAVAQICPITVVDLATAVMSETRGVLDWCDAVVMMMPASEVGLAGAKVALERIGHNAVPVVATSSAGRLAHIASVLERQCFGLSQMRNFSADVDHGLSPGSRKRSSVAKDVAQIVRYLKGE